MKPVPRQSRLSNLTLIKDLNQVADPVERSRTKDLYIQKKDLEERLTVQHFQKLQKMMSDGLLSLEKVIQVFRKVVQEQEKLLILQTSHSMQMTSSHTT